MNVIRKQIVARCLSRLREQKIHTLFAGYLYLQQRSAQLGRLKDLKPEFLPFFRQYFYVDDHPPGAPYVKPFTEQKASAKNLWLNENVAGSYAPSSLRPGQPFRRVVNISGKTYSLPRDHAQRAFEYLLYSVPVPAAELAAFLYRDFGLADDCDSVADLIDLFAYEFGYTSRLGEEPDESFRLLFTTSNTISGDNGWLEPAPDPDRQESHDQSRRTSYKVRRLTAQDLLPRIEPLQPFAELLIDGLLSFGEETRFELGRINVLVGPNGSGKSNLIDCMRVFRYAPYDVQEAFKDSGFDDWLYKGTDKKTAFLQVIAGMQEPAGKIRHLIKLGPPVNSRARIEELIASVEEGNEQYFNSHRGGPVLSVSGTRKRRLSRKLGEDEYDPFQSILSQIRDIRLYPEITQLSSLYASSRIYSEWMFGRSSNLRETTSASRSQASLSESMGDLPLALAWLQGTSAHEKIRDLLSELKETYKDYITRILFGRVGLELVESPFDLSLPASRLSDGTLRFLALAAILLQPEPPPLVCLEEPELGMHPDMIHMVAGMIVDASARMQIILTTHSEHLLTDLQDDFDALFAFDAGLKGSVVRRFSREEFRSWRDEHTLGELWTSGELGGNRW